MRAASVFITRLPFVVLLALSCSDGAAEGDLAMGSGNAGTAGTASNVSAAGNAAGGQNGFGGQNGAGTGQVGPAGSAGMMSGGTSSSTGGTSTAGASGGGLGQGGAQAGAGGAATVPTDGKGLYDANCKLCHLDQGVGSPLAPAIVHPVRDYSNWVVRNGRPLIAPWTKAMEKFGTDKLSDAQLTLIWNYLDEPPQPTTGAALFGDYCANCHGADGKGGPTTRPLANEGKNVLKLVREGKSVGQYAMRHDSMPKFDTKRITDAELNLILAHVNTF